MYTSPTRPPIAFTSRTRIGKVTLFKDNSSGARALRVGPDGRLYAAQPARQRIVSYGPGGDEKVVAQNVAAGDLAITAKGAIYFTDANHKTIGYIDGKGKARVVYGGGEIALPSGVALSPDQAMLIVTDAQSRFSWSFQIAADGSLTNGEPFYRLEMPEAGWMSGVQGVTEDAIGQVYFASALGVQVCEANGRVAAILNPPEPGAVASIAFARQGYELALRGRRRQALPPRRQGERRARVGAREAAAPAALIPPVHHCLITVPSRRRISPQPPFRPLAGLRERRLGGRLLIDLDSPAGLLAGPQVAVLHLRTAVRRSPASAG